MTCSECEGGIKYWLNGRCYAGRSCGERYWGEWVSDPPDQCDPCNQCGNFVGPRCCGPGPLARLWQTIVCCPPCNSCNSCNSCGGAGCSSCGGGVTTYGGEFHGHGNIMHENWDHQPTPAVPGKNIHQAEQPTPARIRTTQRPAMPANSQVMARTAWSGAPQQAGTFRR